MIAGIGSDIVETERVAEKIAKNQGFREYTFSAAEIAYCESNKYKSEHYAGRFAAKEALLKAFGIGILGELILHEIEVINEASGKPTFNFLGATASFIQAQNITAIHLTLSHIKSVAIAFVVVEK